MASALEVMRFFGLSAGNFRKEWGPMTTEDKNHLRSGIGNGSMTY